MSPNALFSNGQFNMKKTKNKNIFFILLFKIFTCIMQVAWLTFRTLTFRQKSYEYNNFVIILLSNLYPFVGNGSLKHHFTCNSFFRKNDVLANFKRK